MDETMFGDKRSGKRGWGASGKWIVFGIYQRNGKVLTFPISSRAKETSNLILRVIPKLAVSTIPMTGLPIYLFTYPWQSCGGLPRYFGHSVKTLWSFSHILQDCNNR